VVVAWEGAAKPAFDAGIRTAFLRTGIVQSKRGGALKKQLPLFKLGLGARFGNGKNYQSWITIDDECAAIIHLLTADLAGPVNLTAPNPVTQAQYVKALGKAVKRPAFGILPPQLPAIALGADLVEALLLDGQRVLPKQLESSGFTFAHPTIDVGLKAVLK
jgi:uncharacterized protein